MNQKTFDDLLQKSRNQAPKTLFQGDLQLNADTYLTPTNLNSQEEVPPPPKALFREEGATVDLDKRMNMLLQPQVPRNPELEALNSYFNQERVEAFARSSLNQVVGERLQREAEMNAMNEMRDEMNRRAGIRRQVLDATGLTPAQIDQQLTAESLAGINPRTMDMRDRQIQDAVDRFYRIQNIPLPAVSNPLPATLPEGVVEEDSETVAQFTATPSMVEKAREDRFRDQMGMPPPDVEDAPPRRPAQRKYDPDIRELPQSVDAVATLPKFALTSLIINNGIMTELTTKRSGGMKSAETLDGIPIAELRAVVEDEVMKRFGVGGGGGGGGVRNPAL